MAPVNLFIGNIHHEATRGDLHELLQRAQVEYLNFNIQEDRNARYAFVRLPEHADLDQAIAAVNRLPLHGRPVGADVTDRSTKGGAGRGGRSAPGDRPGSYNPLDPRRFPLPGSRPYGPHHHSRLLAPPVDPRLLPPPEYGQDVLFREQQRVFRASAYENSSAAAIPGPLPQSSTGTGFNVEAPSFVPGGHSQQQQQAQQQQQRQQPPAWWEADLSKGEHPWDDLAHGYIATGDVPAEWRR